MYIHVYMFEISCTCFMYAFFTRNFWQNLDRIHSSITVFVKSSLEISSVNLVCNSWVSFWQWVILSNITWNWTECGSPRTTWTASTQSEWRIWRQPTMTCLSWATRNVVGKIRCNVRHVLYLFFMHVQVHDCIFYFQGTTGRWRLCFFCWTIAILRKPERPTLR